MLGENVCELSASVQAWMVLRIPACEAVRVGACGCCLSSELHYEGAAVLFASVMDESVRNCDLWTPRRAGRCADVCTAVALSLNLDANVMLCVRNSKFFQYSIRQIGRKWQKVAEMGNWK